MFGLKKSVLMLLCVLCASTNVSGLIPAVPLPAPVHVWSSMPVGGNLPSFAPVNVDAYLRAAAQTWTVVSRPWSPDALGQLQELAAAGVETLAPPAGGNSAFALENVVEISPGTVNQWLMSTDPTRPVWQLTDLASRKTPVADSDIGKDMVTVAPEPHTCVLLVLGSVALMRRRRRR